MRGGARCSAPRSAEPVFAHHSRHASSFASMTGSCSLRLAITCAIASRIIVDSARRGASVGRSQWQTQAGLLRLHALPGNLSYHSR